MGTASRETTPESEQPFEGPKLHIADLPEGTRFRIVGGDGLILTVKNAARGEVSITPFQTDRVDQRDVVEVVELPNIAEVDEENKVALQSYLDGSKSFDSEKAPIGLLRAVQVTGRDQLQRILQQGGIPVYGPDLNSMNRYNIDSDKKTKWSDIPNQSFFTKAPNDPQAGVFLKVSDNQCFLACNVAQWRSGQTKKIVYRPIDEKPISDLSIDENSTVTVLHAPSAEEVQQEVDAYLKKNPTLQGPEYAQHFNAFIDKARNFHEDQPKSTM